MINCALPAVRRWARSENRCVLIHFLNSYGPKGHSFFVKIMIPRCGRRQPMLWDKSLTRKPLKASPNLLTTVIPGSGRLRVKHKNPRRPEISNFYAAFFSPVNRATVNAFKCSAISKSSKSLRSSTALSSTESRLR